LSSEERNSHFVKISLIKIQIFETTGRMSDLYGEISSLLIKLFEKQIPAIPSEVKNLAEKYFKNDFHLNLLRLSLSLLISDPKEAEFLVRSLIISCYEKTSIKGIQEKLRAISQV